MTVDSDLRVCPVYSKEGRKEEEAEETTEWLMRLEKNQESIIFRKTGKKFKDREHEELGTCCWEVP